MFIKILIIVIILLVGLLMLKEPVRARRQRSKAMSWPKVKGKILTSEILEDTLRTATGQIGLGFVPDVTYAYRVGQEEYTGSRISFGSLTLNYTEAESVKSKFIVDADVDVFYNPENAEEALLAPQARRGLKSLIPGIFVCVTAILVGIFSFII